MPQWFVADEVLFQPQDLEQLFQRSWVEIEANLTKIKINGDRLEIVDFDLKDKDIPWLIGDEREGSDGSFYCFHGVPIDRKAFDELRAKTLAEK